MVADAIQEARPEWERITVDLGTIRYTVPASGRRYFVETPDAVRQRIMMFDQGDKRLAPFEFSLPKPYAFRKKRQKGTGPTRKPSLSRPAQVRSAPQRVEVAAPPAQGRLLPEPEATRENLETVPTARKIGTNKRRWNQHLLDAVVGA